MKTIVVDKAEPLGKELVEAVRLDISGTLPRVETLQAAEAHYFAQAAAIRAALYALPQGTRHQLLVMLLSDHENLYRGPDREALLRQELEASRDETRSLETTIERCAAALGVEPAYAALAPAVEKLAAERGR